MNHIPKVILSWDRDTLGREDIALLEELAPYVDVGKVGLQALHAEAADEGGVSVATLFRSFFADQLGKDVMWDMKLNDIDNTVSGALHHIVSWPHVVFATLHATSSRKTLQSAAKICIGTQVVPLAVTLLTDIDSDDCESLYGDSPSRVTAMRLERARDWGISGIVCSVRELAYLRQQEPQMLEGIIAVTPGIRSRGVPWGGQQRVSTPHEAAAAGADYIVVGREVLHDPDPLSSLRRIRDELESAAKTYRGTKWKN